jgi:hypothetical protein
MSDASNPSNLDLSREYIGDNVFAPLEKRAIALFAAWLDRRGAGETNGEPVAWTIPGDENADMNGFIPARMNREGEFTRPLYAHPAVETEAKPHPYLLNGTRFKLSFNRSGYTGSLSNYVSILQGRWVALVAAEDDVHMCGYKPEQALCVHGFFPGNCNHTDCRHWKGALKASGNPSISKADPVT